MDDAHEQRAHNARCVLDLVPPAGGGSGLVVQQTKHIYLERRCPCGHWSRALPGRCDEDERWTVPLSEWHLAGPTLVAFICALTQRMRLSRAKVREFLSDWLGLSLSTALINQCVHEAARAVEPVVEQEILTTVRNVELAYADETSWKEVNIRSAHLRGKKARDTGGKIGYNVRHGRYPSSQRYRWAAATAGMPR